MSVNTPPTENIPIFDPSVFPSSSGTALTIATGLDYFLSYPVAQGSEIFPSNVTLQSTLSDSSGDVGTSGQLLSSTGSGVNWITSGNGYLSLNVSILPYTLPIPSYTDLYIVFTGTGSGIFTLPTTGVPTGTFINIKCLQNGSVSLSTSYILFSNTNVQTTYLGIDRFSAYYNGSAWVQTTMSNRTDNLTVTSTLSVGSFGVDSLIQSTVYPNEINIYSTTNIGDFFIGKILPAPYTVRIANTTAGAAGASVHCSNIGFDDNKINNATAPTTGLIKLANAQTTGPLYLGCGSTTAARTTGPIFIGSDSTASGGINIGTKTDLTIPTVNTVNIGSSTYGTIIKGALTVNGSLTADSGLTLTSGSFSSAGIITGTSVIAPSYNASAAATDVGIATTQTSGVLNIGTGARLTSGSGGGINIGTNSSVSIPINIGGGASSAGSINIGQIGSTTGTTTTNINTSTVGSHPVNIGSTTSATAVGGTLSSLGFTSASGGITATTGNILSSAGSVLANTFDTISTASAMTIGANILSTVTNGITIGTNCLIKMKSPSLANTGANPSTQAATNMTIYGGLMYSNVTTTYTIPASGTINRDFYIVVVGSGTFTVTMPAIAIHQIIHIRNQNASPINLTAPLAGTRFYPTQTGGGLSTTTYSMPANTAQNFYCDGLDWQGV